MDDGMEDETDGWMESFISSRRPSMDDGTDDGTDY